MVCWVVSLLVGCGAACGFRVGVAPVAVWDVFSGRRGGCVGACELAQQPAEVEGGADEFPFRGGAGEASAGEGSDDHGVVDVFVGRFGGVAAVGVGGDGRVGGEPLGVGIGSL